VSEPDDLVGAGSLPDAAFKLIVDRTGHPFVAIEPDGTIRYASGSVEQLLGWPAAKLVGRNMADFLLPEQLAVAIEVIAEIEAVDRDGAGVPMVFGIVAPDGEPTWVEIGAMPLLDVPGVEAIVLRLRPWDAQRQLDAFLDVLLADQPLDEVLAALCRSIARSLEADGAAVHHGFDGTSFAGTIGYGVPPECLASSAGPWCDVAATELPTDRDVAELPDAIAAAAARAGFTACWMVPVPRGTGLAPAVLSVWRSAPGPPLIGHCHLLVRSARYAQLALVRTADHQRLRHLAGHDRLAHAIAIGERDLAVAFCDLDGFKPINDTYGHMAGDAVLVQVADRLRDSLRTGDELARIGGDEFTVLLRNVADADSARHVADRLLATVQTPFRVANDDVTLGLSVGVALTSPGATADELLARADMALYEVKRRGGGGASVAKQDDWT
jgi:diguanylate cyclase (GGDEF)-like protein/PAS domain S-box-containing protein